MTMKREVDKVIYTMMLEFLEDRIELYEMYIDAAGDDAKRANRYRRMLDDITEIKNTFERVYRPHRTRKSD